MVREPFNRADASSLTRCWEWKTIEMWTSWDSHNNGSPIRLGSHHKSERNKRTSSSLSMFSTQVHNLYVNISGGNEMNISTSFICFHFILLYLLVFFLLLRRSAFYDLLLFDDRLSPASSFDCFVRLSYAGVAIVNLSTSPLNIKFTLWWSRLKCALYHPPTCNPIHLEPMFLHLP